MKNTGSTWYNEQHFLELRKLTNIHEWTWSIQIFLCITSRQLNSESPLSDRSFKLHRVVGWLQDKSVIDILALLTFSKCFLAELPDGLHWVSIIFSLLLLCAVLHSMSGRFGSFLKWMREETEKENNWRTGFLSSGNKYLTWKRPKNKSPLCRQPHIKIFEKNNPSI